MTPINEAIAMLRAAGFTETQLCTDEPMARHTSFRIGGTADLLCDARTHAQAAAVIHAAATLSLPLTIIGNGSNLLIRDGGLRGITLRMIPGNPSLYVKEDMGQQVLVCASAGTTLGQVASFCASNALDGMVPLSGIPGSVGGAVIMNAGAYGGEMRDIVHSVEGIRVADESPVVLDANELGFGYRKSILQDSGILITSVLLQFTKGDREDILERMNVLARQRREKQPLEYPSAGSTFKRPEGAFAAKLIDDCGLRGFGVGGAQVSEKHAGFVINRGGATADDVLSLMQEITRIVREQTGFILEPEIRIIGEPADSF